MGSNVYRPHLDKTTALQAAARQTALPDKPATEKPTRSMKDIHRKRLLPKVTRVKKR